ncbi:hypothetical protein MUG78_10945 [Gordonia alkaliphila]|uniref:hypothetical protein n=1 Tax=Gordonia alkaliphila TaxID=1053547 RepID=UPI001FF2D1C0|nr:hypothetical protein [Gordonia alkaliphila]MCK0439959.1 hypothetical protein [Gordonia alkaliphila]
MTVDRHWTALREASKETFGIVSTEQAARYGVAVEQLEAAAAREQVWKTPDELWVVEDVDIFRIEDWAAAWLSIDLHTPITQRRHSPESVVSHQSAAMVRNLGTITTDYLILTALHPLPRTPKIVWEVAGDPGLAGRDWDLVDGLPVSTPSRIITDLAAANGVDGSHLGTVLATILDEKLLAADEVGELMRPYLHRWTQHPELGPGYVIELLINSSYG